MTTTMTRMGQDLTEIKNDLKDLKGTYASKEELNATASALRAEISATDKKYELSRALIFGFCGLVLIAVVGGLIALIINK
jgi:hypothetical protein